MKLRNTYLKSAVLLIATGLLILVMMTQLDAYIKTTLVSASMISLSVICFLQAALHIFNATKIAGIDETLAPTDHLRQWQDYRQFQKVQRHWNMPVYFILLGLTIGFYLFEILRNADLTMKIICIAATYGWMLFAYFYLGKREVRKHDTKLNGVIAELKNLENQFK